MCVQCIKYPILHYVHTLGTVMVKSLLLTEQTHYRGDHTHSKYYTKFQYRLLPIPNLRGNHPIACSGKPNPSKRRQSCLALRTRGGRYLEVVTNSQLTIASYTTCRCISYAYRMYTACPCYMYGIHVHVRIIIQHL